MEIKNVIIDGEAFIFLNGEITPQNSILISEEIYRAKSEGNHVTLKINSPGGSVVGGWNIVDAIITAKADTHIIGMAASMAGIISQFGTRRLANDNAIGMIHPPSNGSGDVFEMIRKGLKTALLKKSKLSEQEITNLLADGAEDTFYDSSEMLSRGLIDEVVTTGVEAVVETTNKQEIFEFYNKLIIEEMDKPDNSALEAITAKYEVEKAAVLNLKESVSTKDEEIKALKEDKEALEAKLKEADKAKATVLIENAIEAGKIKKEGSEKWVDRAVKDFDGISDIFEEIKAEPVVLEDILNSGGEKKEFKDMTPDEKAELARKSPDVYNKLILEDN